MEGCRSSLTCLILVALLACVGAQSRVSNVCRSGTLPCDSGSQCIERKMWCDREYDCVDGSDEEHCDVEGYWTIPDNKCTRIHYVCDNKMCVPATARCDGSPDCKDRSDERGCEEVTTVYNSYSPSYRGSDTGPSQYYPTTDTPQRSYDRTPDYRTQQPSIVERPRFDERNIIYPRHVHHPPRLMPPNFDRSKRTRPVLSLFYFAKNYTQQYTYNYERDIEEAKQWLIQQRDDSYTWGKDTPRALIALSLITNTFTSDATDNDLMKKSLQAHLGIKLLRNNTGLEKMSTTRLAMYINALLATCQNPQDFMGLDLVDILHSRKNTLERYQRFVNPLVHLSLCLADKFSDLQDIQSLERLLVSSFPSEVSKDIHILAMTALACILQRNPRFGELRRKLDEAMENLLRQKDPRDGSFGSLYTTALAAQALMSINSTRNWNPQLTLSYLARNQTEDGSFGDMQSTYYTMLALSGRSLLHLTNTKCDAEDAPDPSSPLDILYRPGPKIRVVFSLKVGYPETYSESMQLTVPADTNFYDIMRVAAHLNSRFRFNYKETNGMLGVHTIANVPNDAEKGWYWNLYHLRQSDTLVDLKGRYTEDIRNLIPHDADELLYWYLQSV